MYTQETIVLLRIWQQITYTMYTDINTSWSAFKNFQPKVFRMV